MGVLPMPASLISSILAGVIVAAVPLAALAQGEGKPAQGVVYEGGDGPGKGKHLVLVSGDEEYRSEEALPQLGKILAQRHGFKCTVLFAIEDGRELPTTSGKGPSPQRTEVGEINPNISNI